jgi:hypothetical protein
MRTGSQRNSGSTLNKEKIRMEMSNIADKVVVITGASSGIGESTAKLLAE